MQRQYLTHRRIRPRLCGDADEALANARLYLCARCHDQVLICSCCDHGNIYCAKGCAEEARRSAQREAGRRYQSSRRGRCNHAKRARGYRARQKKVTHQGSLLQPADDLIPEGTALTPSTPTPQRSPPDLPRRSPWRCHWCGRRCLPFVRTGFLRRRRGADP
jgi:hypothetical protein